jgi:hypothetical protein
MQRWARNLALGGAGILFLLGAVLGGLEIWAGQAEATLNPKATEFLKRYPKTQSNAIALKLNQALSALDLDPVARYGDKFKYTPFVLESDTAEYFGMQFRQASSVLEPLPPNIQTYLNTNQAKLKTAQDLLLTSELPTWELDVDAASNAESLYFNFFGATRLHDLLLLQAVRSDRNGKNVDREQALEAAWKLQEALVQHPLGRTFTFSMVQPQLGLMRYVKGLSPQWKTRVTAVASATQMQETSQLFNWLNYQSIAQANDLQKVMRLTEQQFLQDFRFTPPSFFRLQNANTTQLLDDALKTLSRQNVCKVDKANLESAVPWWNNLAHTRFSMLVPWNQSGAVNLMAEFTQKTLQVKEIATQEGKWPTTLSNLNSKTCDGARWKYAVAPDGTMSLTLENPEPLNEQRTDVIRLIPKSFYTYSDRLPTQIP